MNIISARLRDFRQWYVLPAQTETNSKPLAAAQPEPTVLTARQIRYGQRLMLEEGGLWAVMNALTMASGVVVTAFALNVLQADAFAIGLLSTLPLLAAILQLWTPQIISFLGSRKRVCVLALGSARGLLVPLTMLALFAWLWPAQHALWLILFLVVLTLSAALTAIGATAWLSWATTIIPAEQRAVYFAWRNTLIGLVGLVVALVTGFFLDWWVEPKAGGGHQTYPAAYIVLFLVGSIFGLITIFTLRRTPDMASQPVVANRPRLMDSLVATWKHLPLRRFLIFRSVWLFVMGVAGPYYALYMLKNLNLDFTQIFVLQNIATGASLLTLPLWGRWLEKFGCYRITLWTSCFKVIYVVLWAFIGGPNAFWFLALLHASQFIDAGANLSAGNLLMNLVPDHTANNVGYFSVFTAVTSVVSAIGPLLAGLLIGWLGTGDSIFFGLSFGAIQIIFLLSGLGRLLALPFLKGFED